MARLGIHPSWQTQASTEPYPASLFTLGAEDNTGQQLLHPTRVCSVSSRQHLKLLALNVDSVALLAPEMKDHNVDDVDLFIHFERFTLLQPSTGQQCNSSAMSTLQNRLLFARASSLWNVQCFTSKGVHVKQRACQTQ